MSIQTRFPSEYTCMILLPSGSKASEPVYLKEVWIISAMILWKCCKLHSLLITAMIFLASV